MAAVTLSLSGAVGTIHVSCGWGKVDRERPSHGTAGSAPSRGRPEAHTRPVGQYEASAPRLTTCPLLGEPWLVWPSASCVQPDAARHPLTVNVSSIYKGICLVSKGNSSSPSLQTATSLAISATSRRSCLNHSRLQCRKQRVDTPPSNPSLVCSSAAADSTRQRRFRMRAGEGRTRSANSPHVNY